MVHSSAGTPQRSAARELVERADGAEVDAHVDALARPVHAPHARKRRARRVLNDGARQFRGPTPRGRRSGGEPH